jgi:hypothetical protein
MGGADSRRAYLQHFVGGAELAEGHVSHLCSQRKHSQIQHNEHTQRETRHRQGTAGERRRVITYALLSQEWDALNPKPAAYFPALITQGSLTSK